MDYPFVGRWLVQNSPANWILSHGTTLFATSYTIDFMPVGDTGRTAPNTLSSLLRAQSPESLPWRVVTALCHLQHGSVEVRRGQHLQVGDLLGRCGNSGNSTEPHVHVQAIDTLDIEHANAVPLRFRGFLPRNGEIIIVQEP